MNILPLPDSRQKGQVLLIVILTMVVALTVGLSVVTRTLSDLKTSKQNEESQRAFQAAEAGLDLAIRQIQRGSITDAQNLDFTDINSSNYTVNAVADQDNSILINNGETIDQSIGFDVWLSEYPDMLLNKFSGTAHFYWGDPSQTSCLESAGSAVAPAMEILVLQGDTNDPVFSKMVVDPCQGPSERINQSVAPNGVGAPTFGIDVKEFKYRVDVPVTDGLIMKAIPIFNSTTAAVTFEPSDSSVTTFPAQGVLITSTGKSGETVRKVEYFLAYPQIPNELFPYAIISQ